MAAIINETPERILVVERLLGNANEQLSDHEILVRTVTVLEQRLQETLEEISREKETAAVSAKRVRFLEKQLESSLANNLCPDHRDKQYGKPCLACTIETLERKTNVKG